MARKKQHWARALSDAMNLATTVAAAVAVGYLGGRWLDGRFHTEWIKYVGLLLGVATGMKVMWQRAMSDNQSQSSEQDENGQN